MVELGRVVMVKLMWVWTGSLLGLERHALIHWVCPSNRKIRNGCSSWMLSCYEFGSYMIWCTSPETIMFEKFLTPFVHSFMNFRYSKAVRVL